MINPIQVQGDAGVGVKIERVAEFGTWLGDARQYQFLDDAVVAVVVGAEQLIPTEVVADLAKRFPHTDRDAAFLATFVQVEAEAPDGSVGLGLGNQIRVLLGCENSLLCASLIFSMMTVASSRSFSSWVSLVAMPTCLRIFCRTSLPSRTECTIWTRVRLRSESNFLRMNMAVVIVEREAEAIPHFYWGTTTEVGRIATAK